MKFDKNKEVTNKLKFKPIPEFNNLCLGHLEDVRVEVNEVPKVNDKGQESTWEYAGLNIPQLVFEFKNDPYKEEKVVERFYFHRERIIGSLTKNGDQIDSKILESLYGSMWDRIKHIHDAYSSMPNYKPFEDDIPEIDETAPSETRVQQFTKFFNFVAAAFNKGKDDKTPIYKKNGANITMNMKLVAEYKEGKYLAFPTFVGEGFIEVHVTGVEPTIELKPNETVVLAGKSSGSSEASTGPDNDDLPDEVKEMINRAKK